MDNTMSRPQLPATSVLFKKAWLAVKEHRDQFVKPTATFIAINLAIVILEYFIPNALLTIALWVVGKLAAIWILIVVAKIVKQLNSGATVSGAEMSEATSLLPAATLTAILMGVLNFLLYLLLIVPGIIYSVYWSFTAFVVALTNKTNKEAMDYSKSLVKGRWWLLVGYTLVFGIFMMIPALLLISPLLLAAGSIDQNTLMLYLESHLVMSVYTSVVGDLLAVFGLIFSTYLFLAFVDSSPAATTPANPATV